MAFNDPTWTLNEAVSWAMWRLPESLLVHPYYTANFDDDLSFDGAFQHLSIADAELAVLHLMQRGKIRVSGGGRALEPDEIAAAEIMESNGALRLGFALDGGREGRPPSSIPMPQHYHDRLRLNSDDLRLHLPSPMHVSATVIRIVDRDDQPSGASITGQNTVPPLSERAPTMRGAPTKYHWQEFKTECLRLWDENGGFSDDDPEFSRQSHLTQFMQDWCIDQAAKGRPGWPRCPDESLIKTHVKRFLDAVGWKRSQ